MFLDKAKALVWFIVPWSIAFCVVLITVSKVASTDSWAALTWNVLVAMAWAVRLSGLSPAKVKYFLIVLAMSVLESKAVFCNSPLLLDVKALVA